MADVLKQQTNNTLRKDIWRACDILRRDNNVGGVMEYIEHLAWLLFLRFLDEEEKKRQAEAAFEGQAYVPVIPRELAWDSWASQEVLEKIAAEDLIQFVRGKLLPRLATLSGTPLADTIARIFSDESTGEQNIVRNVPVCASGYNLKDVLEILNKINFESEDDIFTLSKVYEDLLERMGSENRTAGEFYTPRPVIRFMVEVIDPQIGETVYDPACGSAGFPTEAYEHMRKQQQTSEHYDTLQHATFYGQEKKGLSALLGIMNMVLHGVAAPNIKRVNTLEESVKGSVSGRHDIILTNPPFGGKEGKHIQQNFTTQANATELLFMQHIIKKLKQSPVNARAAVVVPEGTLFRGGAFAEVKKDLLEQFHLFAVISLPPGTFAPYSDVKTALLFFQRPDKVMEANPIARDETWYYELPLPEGLKKFSKGSPIEDEHFDGAREAWEQWKAYLAGQAERPFRFSDTIREQWRVHYLWEAYRAAEEARAEQLEADPKAKVDEVEIPQAEPDDSDAARAAHKLKGPKPEKPYTAWLEDTDTLRERGLDLSARNPNQDDRVTLPPPHEITASLLERTRELHNMLEHLHEKVSNGDEEWQN